MPLDASWDLQKNIYETLSSDTTITALLGGAHIYDRVPRHVVPPYITLGQSVARDWSTGTEEGHEHILTLHIWSQVNGKKQTFEIISALRDALHDTDLQLTDHHLINLRHEFSDARVEADGEHMHGIIRYRAVTEPVN